MKLDLNKFYNTNYKDFVHKEAVEEALRMVAEIDLKDVEIDTILSITFSVDEFGENPIYVEYLDKDGKKHIVRIRPAVTNEIQEMLKRYVTLEQHETDKQDIYNHFETLNVPLEVRSQNGLDDEGNKNITLNNDNSFISFQVDPENDEAIQWLCIHNKNGSLGSQYQYMARFVDYAKVDQVPSNAEFLEKIQQLEELIQRKSQETLQSSKEYADAQDDTLRTEIMTNVTNQINETKNDILSDVDVEVGELREYVDNRDTEYHELAKRYADNVKQEAVNSSKTYTDTKTAETLETSKTYTDTKHTEVTQHVTELENDMNTKLNNYLLKNKIKYNDGDFSKINFVHGSSDCVQLHDSSGNLSMTGEFITPSEKNSIADYVEKTSNLGTHKIVNMYWYRDGKTPRYVRLLEDGDYLRTLISKGKDEIITYIPTFKSAKESEVSALKSLVSSLGETNPIEMSVSYKGSALELNNYSSYTTIGDTTIVNINCNFTAPFSSWSAPLLNALNITSETLKSFPVFMIDCITKTATNVSSYTTTTRFSNKISTLYVETPVIKPNETIEISLINFNGSYIFNNTKEAENDE